MKFKGDDLLSFEHFMTVDVEHVKIKLDRYKKKINRISKYDPPFSKRVKILEAVLKERK